VKQAVEVLAVHFYCNCACSLENQLKQKRLKFQIIHLQCWVFTARSKLWSTSQRHIVSESTVMSFFSSSVFVGLQAWTWA